MGEPFIGSEAVAAGRLSTSELRTYHERIFRDVYVRRGVELTPRDRALAGYLWSRRQAIVGGFSAAASYGAKWIDPLRPVELIHDNRHRLDGLQVYGDRVEPDEVTEIGGLPVTTAARTALDLTCWNPIDVSVAAVDALARATDLKVADAELLAQRYSGRRGIRRARRALDLVDPGAESPRETSLRLLLIRAGLPRPQTQIPVYDEFGILVARLDMGWEDVMVAAEYDGDHHRTDRRQFAWDVHRHEIVSQLGWDVVRVVASDRPREIVGRVVAARARRT